MMVTMGGGACSTSYQTEIRYGALVDSAGWEAHLGSSRNYWWRVYADSKGKFTNHLADWAHLLQDIEIASDGVPQSTQAMDCVLMRVKLFADIASVQIDGRVEDWWFDCELSCPEGAHGVIYIA